MEQQGIVCSECSTLNEPGWSFCQQCGKRLTQPAAAQPQPPAAKIQPDLRTVPEQHAVANPIIQGLKTNPEPQPAEHGYKTVVAQPPIEPSKHPLPAAPPTVVADRFVEEPRQSESEDPTLRTLEPPAPPKPTAPTPALPVHEKEAAHTPAATVPKPSIPPTGPTVAPEQTTAHGQAMSGPLCTQCGQSNSVGSAFCASCGAPMTFGKTMVISSQPAPPAPIGRLHLVMEGGQAGEVYELAGDTVIGRNNGEITFPHDGFMSGRHARIERRGSSFILTDEGSRNGTFIKTKGEVELEPGDMILVGKQLFRFEV